MKGQHMQTSILDSKPMRDLRRDTHIIFSLHLTRAL